MRNRTLLLLTVMLFMALNTFSQWKYQDTVNNTINLNSIKMLSTNTGNVGWAAGDEGTILTYDGTSWSQQLSGTKVAVKNVSFISSPLIGWAIADSNIVLQYFLNKWTRIAKIGTSNILQSISLVDINHGWVVGSFGTIYYFDGASWISQSSGTNSYLTSVCFTDTNNGWAVGLGGTILYYNGTNWTSQTNSESLSLYSVYFTDSLHGWAVGDNGEILKYNGIKWQKEISGVNYWLRSVYFTDTMHGWAVGEKGTILKYDGIKWAVQKSPCYNMLLSVNFTDSLHGWIAGEDGRILNTDNGGVEGIDELGIRNFELGINVIPNPVKEITAISYHLPANMNVKISVYDITGREIESLVNEYQSKGDHKIIYNTSSLPDGIYLCRISNGENVLTKKMIKVN